MYNPRRWAGCVTVATGTGVGATGATTGVEITVAAAGGGAIGATVGAVAAGVNGAAVGAVARGTLPILVANGVPVLTTGFGRVIGAGRACGSGVRAPAFSSYDVCTTVFDSCNSRSTPLIA